MARQPGHRALIQPIPSGTRRWRASLLAWDWRARGRWFLAEFLVVVAGILVALALNAWYQNRKDAASEANYLTLLERDLQHTLEDVKKTHEFEADRVRDGFLVYRALSGRDTELDRAPVSLAMSRLGSRRTTRLYNATYEDLLHTGNLQIIRNRELRARLVAFYAGAERQIEIMDKNNAFFVDQMYNGHFVERGLIMWRPAMTRGSMASVDSLLRHELQQGYIDEEDALWSLPAEDPEWTAVKSLVLLRLQIAAYGRENAQALMDSVRELQSAVAAERRRR